jgi:hypothetical protein
MAALSGLRADGPSKAFYQRKRDEPRIHTQALLALARRLVDEPSFLRLIVRPCHLTAVRHAPEPFSGQQSRMLHRCRAIYWVRCGQYRLVQRVYGPCSPCR